MLFADAGVWCGGAVIGGNGLFLWNRTDEQGKV